MSDTRIDAYDKIHENAQCRSVAEVGKRIPGIKDARTVQPSVLRVGHLFLQAYEFEAWIEQPPEQLKLYASALGLVLDSRAKLRQLSIWFFCRADAATLLLFLHQQKYNSHWVCFRYPS